MYLTVNLALYGKPSLFHEYIFNTIGTARCGCDAINRLPGAVEQAQQVVLSCNENAPERRRRIKTLIHCQEELDLFRFVG